MTDVNYTPDFDPVDVDGDYGSTGGDITVPTFHDIKPFRFWCQKALPLVYDDSLSYYEVLCKVVNYLNNMMTDLTTGTGAITQFAQQFVINQQFLNNMAEKLGENTEELEDYINDRMGDFTNAYNELQDYVNQYFNNLDVQDEIDTKLDEMAESGQFNVLFDPVIQAWMKEETEYINTSIANQNSTLAQQNGRISTLEGRMDTFASLPSGSTSGNAELLDIRTNFLGETYPSAGDAVRASDMIASGFQSISATKLEEWDGNDDSSVYDTIQIDISGYKGGHVAVIGSFLYFQSDLNNMGSCSVYATNTPGKVEDANAVNYFPGGANSIFTNFTQITTNISGEERLLLQFAIPDDFAYQYLKIGHFNHGALPGSYTEPQYIVYANSWSKTQVDPTLSITGDAADAKATGDALSELNERIDTVANDFYAKYDNTGNFISLSSDEVKKVILSASNPVTVLHCGKNLLAKPYYHNSPLISGVQFTYNTDGSITAVGTATENASYVLVSSDSRRAIKKGTYHLSGCPDNLDVSLIFSLTGVGDIKDEGEGVTINVGADSTYYLRFLVRSGTTINTTIYPMLNYGNEASIWEEYVSENISVNNEVNVNLYEGVNNFISDNTFVAETFVAKEINIINLRECGAVGDGVTDDTDALNSALQSAKYKTLYIPKGTYLVSGTINVPSNTKVVGCGSESVIKLSDVFELTGYEWRDYSQFTTRYPIMITDENSNNCVFKDFSIVGQTTTFVDHDEDGLVLRGNNIVVENLIIHDINYFTEEWSTRTSPTLGFGIFVFNAEEVFINNTTVYNCGYQDIGIENANNCCVQSCNCGIANQTGIQVHRNSKNVFIKNNVIDLTGRVNGHAALTIDAPSNVSAENIHVENNYICGTFVTVGGGENKLFIVNNEIIGTVQFNSNFFVDRVVIIGNLIDGRITLWANNTMVCNNIIDNPATSSYMIRIHGTKAVAVNNNAIGEGNGDTYITEQ